MSLHKKKITLRVTSQTAFHLEEMARKAGTSEGRIVDELVKAARPCVKVVEIVEFHVKQQEISLKS